MTLDVLSFRLTRIAGRLVSTATCALTGRSVFAATGLVALGLGAAQAQAATPLLDFSNGLTGWTTQGNVTVTGTAQGGLPLVANQNMVVINTNGAPWAPVDTALGLSAGSIDTLLGAGSTNFGYATTTTSLVAGVYSFTWAFTGTDSGSYYDGALFTVAGAGTQSVTSLAHIGTFAGPSPGTIGLNGGQTVGWQTTTFTVATDGSYQVGFASYNWGDTSVSPIFYLASRVPALTIATTLGDVSASVYSTASAAYAESTLTFGGGTLQFGADTATNKNTVLNAGGGTIDTQTHDVTMSGDIGGTGGLTKTGTGTLVLSGTNSYGGGTTVAAGTLQGDTRSLQGDITNNASLVFTQASNGTYASAIGGTGDLTVQGGGTVAFTGTNTYSGATTVDAGTTLALVGGGSIGQSSHVVVDGTLDLTGATAPVGLVSLDGTGRVHLGTGNPALTAASGNFGGVIDGSGGLQVLAGTQTLSGVNTYTGNTRVVAGATIALVGDGSIATSAGVSVAGTLDISGTSHGATVTEMFGSGTVQLGQRTLTIRNDATPFDGTIVGGGNVVLAGGTTVLMAAQGYTGTTTIASDGGLALMNGGSVAASSGIVNDGRFEVSSTGGATVARLTGSGVTVLAGESLTIAQAGGTYGGQIVGSGGLRIADGTQTLTQANGYTGTTRIDAGANVVLSGSGGFTSSSAVTVDGGLDLAGTTAGTRVSNLRGSGHVALGANTLTLGGTAGNFAGDIAGAGGVTLLGGAGLTLSGANTYAGTTQVRGGATLALAGAGTVGTSDVVNAGTIDLTGATSPVTFKSLTGAGQVALGSQTLTLEQGRGAFTGSLTGTGNLVLRSGSLAFGTDQAYTGTTTVAGGVLSVNANLAGAVNVASGAALHGSGRIAGPVTVAAGGTLAPGNSPGVLTTASTVTMAAGSTFEVDVNGPTAGNGAGFHDQLVVTGAGQQFAANGAALDVHLTDIAGLGTYTAYVPVLGESYRIAIAEGGLGNTRFAPIAQPDGLAAGTRLRLVYITGDGTTPEAVDLKVVPTALVGNAGTRNAQATAAALDRLIDADEDGVATARQSRLANAVLALDVGALDATVVALSGEIHGALAAAQPLSGQLLQGAVAKHLSMSPQSGDARLTGWADYSTGETKASADAVSSGMRSTHNQLTVGVDVWQSGASRAGVAMASTSTQVSSSAGSTGKLEDQLGVLYGQHGFAGVVGDAQLGYGTGHSRSRRADPLASQDEALTTNLSTRQNFAGIGVRKAFDVAGTTLEPFARFSVQRVRREAGTETGSALTALSVDALSASGNRTSLGLSVTGSENNPMVSQHTFRGTVALGHDGGDLLRPVVGTTLAGVAAAVQAPEAGRTFVAGNVFGTWLLAPGAYAYAGIGGEARSQRVQKSVAVGAAIVF